MVDFSNEVKQLCSAGGFDEDGTGFVSAVEAASLGDLQEVVGIAEQLATDGVARGNEGGDDDGTEDDALEAGRGQP